MGVLVAICMAAGGIIEFLPTFLVESNIPTISSVKPYTPLEIEGRDIYVKEGCFNCHSQMVRTIDKEVVRYGPKSEAGEFIYDRPFQFGSKRTGPDLHRVGGKYPDLWHYRHMMDPREISPGSVMPAYPWLAEKRVVVSRMEAKMKALKTLGTPYSDERIRNYASEYKAQADDIVSGLSRDGVELEYDKEMVALIAYLQRLGTDLKKSTETAAKGGE
jgi:cytochrome c oxidase, cbb3-type, subunit II